MRKYSPAELKTFLEAIDHNLEVDFSMIIIGGCAAALAYKADRHSQESRDCICLFPRSTTWP
jgi:hypothetical protein